MQCIECGKECKSIFNHLKVHKMASKTYYDKYLKKGNEDICANIDCTNITKFRGVNYGYAKFCSIKCSSTDPETIAKKELSMLKNHGVTNPSFCPKIVRERTEKLNNRTKEEKEKTEKIKQENSLKNWGTTHPMKNSINIKKVQTTNLEKQGSVCSLHGEIPRQKTIKTNLRKRGVKHHMHDPNVVKKLQTTITLKRKPLIKDILLKVYGLELLNEFKNNSTELEIKCIKCGNVFTKNYFNIYQRPSPCQVCYPSSSGVSKPEKEIREFLESLGISCEYNCRNIIKNKKTGRYLELDIYIPSLNLAIEYDGFFWHKAGRTGKFYHSMKTDLCNEKGISLIHIFEDEWVFNREIVIQRLLKILGISSSKVIYARDKNISIKEIDAKTKNKFLEKYHLQGVDRCSIKLGAFYYDELVSVMTFSKKSISKGSKPKEGEWELSRFSSNFKYHIQGVAGKLVKYFQRNYKWTEIISYADRRWSQGKLYYSLGFDFEKITVPNYWYIKDYQRIHRYNLRKRSEEPKELTEIELRLSEGYDMIWDCGSYKFVLRNTSQL